MDRPRCPSCGAFDARPPDPLGVHSCPACAIEFRPLRRMPIRRASVTVEPHAESKSLLVAVVIVGVLIGVASARRSRGTTRPSYQPPPITFEPIKVEQYLPPVLDPALLESLSQLEDPNLLFTVPLEHEVHRLQLVDGRLFATGQITAAGSQSLDEITVAIQGGASSAIHRAVVSCTRMQPGEVCAWMIDEELDGTVGEVEITATGRLAIGLPQFELRDDSLTLDAERGMVKFRTTENSVLGPWATVTAYDSSGQVLGVSKTLWPDRLLVGRQRRQVAVPESAEAIERYEVRVGGLLADW